jgi:hypothetical protein
MAVQASISNKREHDRVSDPAIRLQIGSKIYRSINWSLGGVLIDGYEGGLSTGSLLSINELGLSRGVMTPVNISARVIRADAGANHLAIQMLEIDQSAYAILQKLLARKHQVMKARPVPG